MNTKTKSNQSKFNALWKEVKNWAEGSDQNGSLEFCVRNGFKLHAVSQWIGSGASQLPGCAIDRKEELAEIEQLLNYAVQFRCVHCNHYSYFEPDAWEADQITIKCESCLKSMKRVVKFKANEETELPGEAIESVPSQGAADDAVEYLRSALDVEVDAEELKEFLSCYGAWNDEELSDHDNNIERLLWLACLDCQENNTTTFYFGE